NSFRCRTPACGRAIHMTSPLRRKHPTTQPNSLESSTSKSTRPTGCHAQGSPSACESVARALAAALVLGVSSLAHADSAWNTTSQQPKLVWRAIRPTRPDAAGQDSSDKAKQASKYDQNVFDDDSAPASSKQITLISGEGDVVDASTDASDLPSVRARR